MGQPIIECVPNFSEGRDQRIVQAIAEAVRSVDGAVLLDVDPGAATNRTVYTFAGSPEAVCEAAFRAAKVGTELIDMRRHQGEHPRFGALDVCPLVPISGITMEETVAWARKLAERLGSELGLTVYLYEQAATSQERRNLADVRAGEYEGLAAKLADPAWAPDFGPARFNPKSGATACGARKLLVAYNINLNTTSPRRANAVAFDVRERGRVVRKGDPLTGEIVRDDKGEPVYEPGALKSVKAIGWYIEEYGVAQVSMNLTDLEETPIHVAFDVTDEKARVRGLRVTGSEVVGLVPLKCLLDAGRYFLHKQRRSSGVSDDELIKIAVKSMGLDELKPFVPEAKVIELALERAKGGTKLSDMSLRRFVHQTASESPAPGGGSVAAAMGAMGAALGTMVANLSSHKRGWDEHWREFSDWADKGKALHDRLLQLVDEDTDAFNRLMAAFGLPKATTEEAEARARAIQEATREAIRAPLETMRAALASLEIAEAMARQGNPNSVSDAGVAALAARSAVLGARLNVLINCGSLEDADFVADVRRQADDLAERAMDWERKILETVAAKL
jgi:glutamate formiminotransferase/formiminotetrahydrofolate cyclodeaminase